jgi:hypothetical protein
MKLKNIFPDARFNCPATMAEIELTESELRIKLPKQLTDLYLETDGFRENMGNSQYLLSLRGRDESPLIEVTRFYWGEIEFDNFNVKDYVFLVYLPVIIFGEYILKKKMK